MPSERWLNCDVERDGAHVFLAFRAWPRSQGDRGYTLRLTPECAASLAACVSAAARSSDAPDATLVLEGEAT